MGIILSVLEMIAMHYSGFSFICFDFPVIEVDFFEEFLFMVFQFSHLFFFLIVDFIFIMPKYQRVMSLYYKLHINGLFFPRNLKPYQPINHFSSQKITSCIVEPFSPRTHRTLFYIGIHGLSCGRHWNNIFQIV